MRVVVHQFSKDAITHHNAGGAHADQYGVLHVYAASTGIRGRELRGHCLAGYATGSWTSFEVKEDLPEKPVVEKPVGPPNEEVTQSGKLLVDVSEKTKRKRRIFKRRP